MLFLKSLWLYFCSFCKSEFSKYSAFERNAITHEEISFSYDFCNAALPNNYILLTHKLTLKTYGKPYASILIKKVQVWKVLYNQKLEKIAFLQGMWIRIFTKHGGHILVRFIEFYFQKLKHDVMKQNHVLEKLVV